MAKRNYRGSFRGYRNQHQSNVFQYHGPYPQNEIKKARELLNHQFYNSSGRALRSLRQKMYNSVNFYHQQQIDSVIPSSFSAFQESSTSSVNDAEITLSSDGITTIDTSQGEIDIHTVVNDYMESNDTENITVNVSNKSKSVTVSVTSRSNSSIEPPEKRQRLSNETINSQSVVTIDPNGNVWNGSTSSTELSKNITSNETSGNSSNYNSNEVITNHNSSDTIHVSSGEEEGELSSDSEEPAEETELCLMCDLCLHVVRGTTQNSKTEMENHFVAKKHNAASLVQAIVAGDKLIPIFVEEKHRMSNNSFDSSILPVCPECYQIHGNVWTCALHYQQNHNVNEDNVYGLGKVVSNGVCQVSSQHWCTVCHQTFPFAAKLHKHWKSQKHFPFKEPTSNQIMQFTCGDCGRRDQSFLMARGHILSAHVSSKNNKSKETDLKYIYLEITDKLSLLPQKSKLSGKGIKENKELFKKAVGSANLTKNQKRKLRRSVLPSKKAMMEYKYGEDYDPERERYERFLKNRLHYSMYHFSQKT